MKKTVMALLNIQNLNIESQILISCDVFSTDLPEKQEQLQTIYKVLEELPPANFTTLERLIFHLVRSVTFCFSPSLVAAPSTHCSRVAMRTTNTTGRGEKKKSHSHPVNFSRVCKDEAHNRMSPNSLAIVFAPCILRCPDSADPLLSMRDVAKTTS